MPDVTEDYNHTVPRVLTVGDLRTALRRIPPIPEDTALVCQTAQEPGSDLAGEEQIIYSAEMGETYHPQKRATSPTFEVSLEFRPGTYERPTTRTGSSASHYDEFEHTVAKVFTVGDLKAAIKGIPDDMPMVFTLAEEPGSDLAGEEQIAYDADMSEVWDAAASREAGKPVMRPAFVISLEFRPGIYSRTVWKDDPS